MLVDTMASPAWKAMSPYARVVYYTLKSRYGHKIRNNGRIYLSARDGAEETGFDMKTVARSLRELRHYGFIVITERHCLGVEGKGKATHWRLTELGYMHEPPTRDFLKWDGEMFHEQKSPAYYKRQKRSLSKLRADTEKQNPVPLNGTGCTTERHITVFQGAEFVRTSDPLRVCPMPCRSMRRVGPLSSSVGPPILSIRCRTHGSTPKPIQPPLDCLFLAAGWRTLDR